jgi:hypothetical protein
VDGGDGGTTTVASISPSGAWFEIDDVTVTGSVSFEDIGGGLPNHITFRNVNAGQPAFWDGGDTISWIGGTIGPYALQPASFNGCLNLQGIPNNLTNVTLRDLQIVGCTRSAARIAAGDHTEAIRVNDGVSGLTLSRLFFNSNDVNSACVFLGSAGGRAAENNITIENSYFGSGCNKWVDANLGSASSTTCTNWIFDYNTSSSDSPGTLNSLHGERERLPGQPVGHFLVGLLVRVVVRQQRVDRRVVGELRRDRHDDRLRWLHVHLSPFRHVGCAGQRLRHLPPSSTSTSNHGRSQQPPHVTLAQTRFRNGLGARSAEGRFGDIVPARDRAGLRSDSREHSDRLLHRMEQHHRYHPDERHLGARGSGHVR